MCSELRAEAQLLRTRLDTATAADEKTRTYVERLEAMVDEARLPEGDELISEIERFLRDRGSEPGHGQSPLTLAGAPAKSPCSIAVSIAAWSLLARGAPSPERRSCAERQRGSNARISA